MGSRRYTMKKKIGGKFVSFRTQVTSFYGLRREAYKAVELARSIERLENERIETLAKWVKAGGSDKIATRLHLLEKEKL